MQTPRLAQGEVLTATLAAMATGVEWENLPQPVHAALGRVVLDHIASVAAGAGQPVARAARGMAVDALNASAGQGQATILTTGLRAAPQDAAFANGTAAHALDFDDGHREGSAHPGGAVIPAALALAEQLGRSWEEFAAAVVAGYEVMLRIAAAMHPASAGQGWHNSAITGVFGSTAAAGRLLRLDAEQMAHALGLAASFAGGIREYLHDGSDVKRLHLGKAARDGLLCAHMAQRGVTGSQRVLEGANGLFRAMAVDRARPARVLQGLGEAWEITQVYFKPYPCCRHFQAAIDAMLALRETPGSRPTELAAIEIGLYAPALPGHEHYRANTLLDAQMSAPWAMVTTLVHGHPGLAQFQPDALPSADAKRLLQATRVVVDPVSDAEYPARRGAVVRLIRPDGSVLEQRVRDPRGEAENPLSDTDLTVKFVEAVAPVIGAAAAELLADDILTGGLAGRPARDLAERLMPPTTSD